jgi:hypothetical protein
MLGLVGAGLVGIATGGAVARRLTQAGDPASLAMPVSTTSATTTSTSTTSTSEPVVDATTTTEAPPRLQAVDPYQPVADEVFVEAKLAGVRFVEALMTYEVTEAATAPVERALSVAVPSLTPAAVAHAATTMIHPEAQSSCRIVYPQLGGLHPHSAPTTGSIMVIADQHLLRDGVETVVSRCVDVRVALEADGWRVTSVENDSGPPVPPPPAVDGPAARVLAHPDITMPDSIRWDIYDGIVDDRILTEMADLADRTPIAATSCMRGHPVNVYATAGLSAHTVGRAVDIWAVGGLPVVAQRHSTDSVAHQVSRALYDGGRVHRLGAPWAFDGAGGRSWTDPVHLDHLHLGVSA